MKSKKNIYRVPVILFIVCFYLLTSVNAQDIPSKISIGSSGVEIPIQLISRKPVVEVKINGNGPYKFFLDTGAGATVLDQKLADELKLQVKGTTRIGDPKSPQAIEANQNWVDKLEIGNAVFQNFIAVSWDRSGLYSPDGPRGVLGMPLFRKLLLTINYLQNKILIRNGKLDAGNNNDIIDYQLSEADLFGVPLQIAGTNYTATLDTGSAGGISFPNDFMDKLPLDAKPVEIGRARSVAGESVVYGSNLKGDVKIGNYQITNPRVAFFDRLTHINIGYDFLKQFSITIDQENRRMKFEKTELPNSENKTQSSPKSETSNSYTGLYGERRITVENGDLYLQRISGPQGESPKIKLAQINKDEFGLPETNIVRVKFTRNQSGDITEIQVLTPQGAWETSKRK